MELVNSFSSFFYNIIPGFVFLFLNSLYFNSIKTELFKSENETFAIFQIIVLSIFLGFVFQSLTKFLRDLCFNQLVISEIEVKDKDILEDAEVILKKIKSAKKEKHLENIYLMHDYLVSKYKVLLPEFFSPRLALWSNIFFASLITIFLILLSPLFGIQLKALTNSLFMDILLLLIVTFYSWEMSRKYLKALFDSIIRTFVSVMILNENNEAYIVAKPKR